jgi:hypothetical protein
MNEVRRVWAAGAAALALTAGVAGCSGDTRATAAKAAACTDGTYTWTGVRHWSKLTALGDPVTFTKATDTWETDMTAVGAEVHRPEVTGTPAGVGAAPVIKALGTHLKVEEPLADPSEEERPGESHFAWDGGDLEGAYYRWSALGFVDADFTYTCGRAAPARGHVHTWETVGGGFLPCADPTEDAVATEAAGKLCPAGSRAAQGA